MASGIKESPQTPTILLLGMSGAGKSRFISAAIREKAVDFNGPFIGNGTESCTTTVQVFEAMNPDNKGEPVRLVDTPGFDNSDGSGDDEQLRVIIHWLEAEPSTKVNGILYLHDIRQWRVIGDLLMQPQDISWHPGACVVTTNWPSPPVSEQFQSSEDNIRKYLAARSRSNGSHDTREMPIQRFDDTTELAWKILTTMKLSSSNIVMAEKLATDLRRICVNFEKRNPSRANGKLLLGGMSKRDKGSKIHAKLDGIAESSASEIVTILLLGQTGAGKSQFIRVAAGIAPNDPQPPCVGHNVTSETDKVDAFSVTHPKDPRKSVQLIDTPGFNDSNGDIGDDQNLTKVIQWLKKEPHATISGVLYLHEIIQVRAINTGTVKPKDIPLPLGIFVVTTKWSSAAKSPKRRAEEEIREGELQDDLELPPGSMRRFDNSRSSAWDIIADVQRSPAKVTRGKLAEDLEILCPQFQLKQQDRSLIKRMARFFRKMF